MSGPAELPVFGEDPVQKSQAYRELDLALAALLLGEHDWIANLANTSALIYQALPQLNWAGFYLWQPAARAGAGELVLGPFQGKPACVRIAPGRGVCGTAALERSTVLVPNVHDFPGHIACDAASNSEIVIPLVRGDQRNGELVGVLDLDSPIVNRFDAIDREGLERLAATLLRTIV
jgi:L-methionine (R)-S-oxide reductase